MQIGFFGIVFLVLLVLKLTGVAAITWFWVFSPLILGAAIGVVFLVVWLIGAFFLTR